VSNITGFFCSRQC